MAGSIAHDYQKLMQAILGYATQGKMQMEEGIKPGNFFELIEKYSDEALHLGQMLSILGSDYADNTPKRSIIPCILDSIRKVLAGTSIALSVDCPENLSDCTFSDQQMQLVFSG